MAARGQLEVEEHVASLGGGENKAVAVAAPGTEE